jgi:DNA gyrase subunit A
MPERMIPIDIEDEMKSSFLDYSMSVIISRALPDARDGLKPVHRRILYTLKDLALFSGKPYRKCAKIAGDVSGNYHPHGEGVIYPSIVRLAQDFSLRYPLIDGQGNFGSIDGDPPAAMRYTEARMGKICEEMLADIDKETVDFVPNYDGSQTEPVVIPARIPNLLVNGSQGIAVGMATNIPPHNLGETVDALIHLINHPEATIDDLMGFIRGPDFPTGAIIYAGDGLRSAYESGRGIIKIRARAGIEETRKKDRELLVITEIPYMVNKANLLKAIASLVQEKKIDGVYDLRDESDREGIRIVLEVKSGISSYILSNLYLHTQLQVSFGIILLAIINNQPKVFNLKELLSTYLDHRREVITRRTLFDLKKAEERAHILEGLLIALANLDAVINLIRRAESPEKAKEKLIRRFSLTDVQAQAILDIPLKRITRLEREKIDQEHKELKRKIKEYEDILADPKKVERIIISELEDIKKTYADERRTAISLEKVEEVTIEDTIKEEDVVITVTHGGYIKRTPASTYRNQRRGGKGRMGMVTAEEDFVEDMFIASSKSYVLVITNLGRLYWLKAYDIPDVGPASKGKAVANLLSLKENEKVAAMVPVPEFSPGKYLLFVTKQGIVKRTELTEFSHPRVTGVFAISIGEGDELLAVKLTDGKKRIFLGTRKGKSILFPETEVRSVGRTAGGVIGIRLAKDDLLVGTGVISTDAGFILSVTTKGYGKRTPVSEYRLQARGGKGIINLKTSEKTGEVIGVKWVAEGDEVIGITEQGKLIRMRVKKEVPVYHRASQGARLIHLDEADFVAAIASLREAEE